MEINELTLLNNIVAAGCDVLSNIDSLESFIRDGYCNCFNNSLDEKKRKWGSVFSHLGEKNNPPDYMVALGSAGEIKSLASLTIPSQIQFNSSFPLDKMRINNPRITKACIQCERWIEKPMVYVIGHVVGKTLNSLLIVSGKLLFTPTTESLSDMLSSSVNTLEDMNVAETTELARINNIGYYNNISLRVRGMWLVEHPFRTFRNIFCVTKLDNNTCKLCALLDAEGIYDKISIRDKHRAELLGLSVAQYDIPDNTGRMVNSVAICKDIELGGSNA